MQRRNSNCHTAFPTGRNRVGKTCKKPVHISFYLDRLMDKNGKPDVKKISESFKMVNYG